MHTAINDWDTFSSAFTDIKSSNKKCCISNSVVSNWQISLFTSTCPHILEAYTGQKAQHWFVIELKKKSIAIYSKTEYKGKVVRHLDKQSTRSSNEIQRSVESPFSVHVLSKKNEMKTHYITVTLATLKHYIIENQ